MTLLDRLGTLMTPAAKSRGLTYYRQGRAAIVDRAPTEVVIEIAEEGEIVVFGLDRFVLRISCTCPAFADRRPCKHVWAAALAVQNDAALPAFHDVGDRFVNLIDDEAIDEDEDGDLGPVADDWIDPSSGRVPGTASWLPALARTPVPVPRWKQTLAQVSATGWSRQFGAAASPVPLGPSARLLYAIDLAACQRTGELVVNPIVIEPKANGGWRKPRALIIAEFQIPQMPDAADRLVLAALVGARPGNAMGWSSRAGSLPIPQTFEISPTLAATLVPAIAATGRLAVIEVPDADPEPLTWDAGEAWRCELTMARSEAGTGDCVVSPWLVRGDRREPLASARLITPGLVGLGEVVARFDDRGQWAWVSALRQAGDLPVGVTEIDAFVAAVYELPDVPPIGWPPDLSIDVQSPAPVPCLRVEPDRQRAAAPITGWVSFDYGGQILASDAPGGAAYDAAARRATRRDRVFERQAIAAVEQAGFRRIWPSATGGEAYVVPAPGFPMAVSHLVAAGWRVEADGRLYRPFNGSGLSVCSGIDWFELRGQATWGDQVVPLPELLAALSRGHHTIRLGDGTIGLLPEEWLRKVVGLASLGEIEGDHIRYRMTQAALLDALLAAQPAVDVDAGFERARAELASFEAVVPLDPASSFVGCLREYQREGLGWIEFLRRFGFGGCLADDMGLGKTIMMLAMLDRRRGDGGGPSIVVAPRSVVYNWLNEAARFTPALRVAGYTGGLRHEIRRQIADLDLLVTSYGTLRNDAAELMEVEFDFVVLDEAQAIKNANTASARAARLLRGRHRLALTGTPVENHLGELWSLFEFLNPGLLGSGLLVGRAVRSAAARRELAAEHLPALARGLRPFILRRTKKQVARDLPPRQEDTIWCELDKAERRRYDELRAHYRATLLGHIEKTGLGRSKIRVLEALLRLRQAACHQGLLDPTRAGESSAKLDALFEQLDEILVEDHKAIVFSQFTSLLAIVCRRLDLRGIEYAYLDGRTHDREAAVNRFQTDPRCRLFLISLKAGGLGLNLTAADYVYLLDPWWNPAAEAQAIDRAHRIGQTRPVFAYRLVARDTVEERILDLQRQKREVADAIIGEDNSVIAQLTREELEALLR